MIPVILKCVTSAPSAAFREITSPLVDCVSSFVVAFVNDKLPESDRSRIQQALLEVGGDKALAKVMETKLGFVPVQTKKK